MPMLECLDGRCDGRSCGHSWVSRRDAAHLPRSCRRIKGRNRCALALRQGLYIQDTFLLHLPSFSRHPRQSGDARVTGRTLVTRRGHWGLGTISSYFTTRARVNFGAKITNEGSPRSTEPPETDGDRDTAPKPCLTVATQSCDQAVTLATTGGSRHRPYFKVRTQ
jgi:hypothetical protein